MVGMDSKDFKVRHMKTIRVGSISLGNSLPLALVAGPCVVEGHQHAKDIACYLAKVCKEMEIPFIFKASFDKANRTSVQGHRGMGLDQALKIFEEIRHDIGCPVVTDVHHPEQCASVAKVVDLLQIPALLCRQTDLIQAAASTGKPLLIKKGQFLSPQEMSQVVKKAETFGNPYILVCERGSCFGYHTLVNDMKGLPILASTGYPIVFDATHSVQRPGALGSQSGGERQFVETLARAAVGVGVAAIFMETHPDPSQALSDGPNMVPLDQMHNLLTTLKALDQVAKSYAYAPFSMGTFSREASLGAEPT